MNNHFDYIIHLLDDLIEIQQDTSDQRLKIIIPSNILLNDYSSWLKMLFLDAE